MQMGRHSGRLFFGRGIFAFTAFNGIFVCFSVDGIMLDSGLLHVACLLHPWTVSSPCLSSHKFLAIRHGKNIGMPRLLCDRRMCAFGYWGGNAVEIVIFT